MRARFGLHGQHRPIQPQNLGDILHLPTRKKRGFTRKPGELTNLFTVNPELVHNLAELGAVAQEIEKLETRALGVSTRHTKVHPIVPASISFKSVLVEVLDQALGFLEARNPDAIVDLEHDSVEILKRAIAKKNELERRLKTKNL